MNAVILIFGSYEHFREVFLKFKQSKYSSKLYSGSYLGGTVKSRKF